MRFQTLLIASFFALGLAATDADARFGKKSNLGTQRAAPAKSEPPASVPAKPAAAPATPAANPAGAAAKPSFMSRWGGLLAGLGIGVLLASLFGAQMGPIVGMLLAALLVGGLAFLAYRLFVARKNPVVKPSFAGIGSGLGAPGVPPTEVAPVSASALSADPVPAGALRPNFDVETFLRGAKTTFIRLQAADDARDLDDIKQYTTPEIYAEIAMQIQERGAAPQKTEVVNLNAQLVEVALEDGYDIASVRFAGLIRENDAANPEPFDEVWHVRKKAGDKKPAWLIAGIQQTPE